MYQPTVGRFISIDPLSADGVDVIPNTGWFGQRLDAMREQYGAGADVNPYRYVFNNPVVLVDPSGQSALVCSAPWLFAFQGAAAKCAADEMTEKINARLVINIIDQELDVNFDKWRTRKDGRLLEIIRKPVMKMTGRNSIRLGIETETYTGVCCVKGKMGRVLTSKKEAGTETTQKTLPVRGGAPTSDNMKKLVNMAYPLPMWIYSDSSTGYAQCLLVIMKASFGPPANVSVR